MPSTQLLLARAIFGLSAQRTPPVPRAPETAAAIDTLLLPGQIALITGPSGAGKSTILAHLRAQLRARNHAAILVNPARLPTSPPSPHVIDAFRAPLPTTLSLLASCGLAEASILERRIHELSTGQRWRLSLALAMHRTRRLGAHRHATLLVDEFASLLDSPSAQSLCRTLRRWITTRPIRAVCATHDDSLFDHLNPDILVFQPLHAAATIHAAADQHGLTQIRKATT